MALKLYRRHRTECEGGHPEDSKSGEFEEGRRGWKRCGCVIHAAGTIKGKFSRKQTGKSIWEEAKTMAAEWEKNGWEGELPATVRLPEIAPVPAKTTIAQAIADFVAEGEAHLAANTQRQNKSVLAGLQVFSDSNGYVLLEQWTPSDVRKLRASWQVAPNTAAKNMAVVKAFFTFCADNEWIERSPAKKVKAIRGKSSGKERIPFSDEELQEMYDACDNLYGKTPLKWSRDVHHRPAEGEIANYRYKWTGQDLRDFISVSVYTGLRISDVCTFHIDRLQPSGECHVRTTKTGRKVYTWIPEWLQQRIRDRVKEHGPLVFGRHRTDDINVITDVWRRKLNRLWALIGPWKEKPTPHRFRHTFARILLEKPTVTVRDVAELLGDTEEMVRKHYAAWVRERQERLTSVLREAFADKPGATVVISR